MVEQTAFAMARCEDCDKVYRVPRRDRTYRCKACGGTVRPDGVSDAALEPPTPPLSSEEAAEVRREVNGELKRAYKWIDGVRWLYRMGAFAYAVATLLAVLALSRTDVPREAGILVVGLTTLMAVLMLMGALHILFKPFIWTLVIASMASAVSVVHFFGPDPFGLACIGSALLAVLAWAALAPALHFRRLIEDHRDLYIMHHASGRTRRSVKDRSPEERHERLLTAMRRAARRAWRISATAAGVLVLASAVGTFTVVSSLRPQELSVAIEGFETAWNDTGLTAAVAFFAPLVQAPEGTRLAGVTQGHGWGEGLPALVNRELRRDERLAWVDYDLEGIPMSATWLLNGQTWSLIEIDLPTPPLEPILDQFVEAWRGSDPEALVSFFSADTREAMLGSIRASAQRRRWTSFPEIVGTQMDDYSGGSAEVVHALERGEITTQWYVRADGTWGLHGLKFPKR